MFFPYEIKREILICRKKDQLAEAALQRASTAGDFDKINALLRHMRNIGCVPSDINAMSVKNAYTTLPLNKKTSLIEILFYNQADIGTADWLLNNGASLPLPQVLRTNHPNTESFFFYLLHSHYDLYATLITNPNIINQHDKNGWTLLHYAALQRGACNDGTMDLLLRSLVINFSALNSLGDTALHMAAYANANDMTISRCTFPRLLREAQQRGFDFTTKGDRGQTILHIAARVAYNDPFGLWTVENNIERVFKIATNAITAINVLSGSGSSALYYAINSFHLASAKTLLNHGADPELCGSDPSRNPMVELESKITLLTNEMKSLQEKSSSGIDENSTAKLEHGQELLEKLETLKMHMEDIIQSKHSEIHRP